METLNKIGVYHGTKSYKQRCEEVVLEYLKRTGKRLHHWDCCLLLNIMYLKDTIKRLREQGHEIEEEEITTIGLDCQERYHTEYWIKTS